MNSTGPLLLATVVAAAALVGVAFLSYKKELGCAYNAARRSSLIASTDAGPIEYAERGAGIPLLSIHGAGGGFDQGLANAAEFVDQDFRIIAPSRFGYLRTPVPRDPSPAAQADAHAALLSHLNIPRAIVGWCFGRGALCGGIGPPASEHGQRSYPDQSRHLFGDQSSFGGRQPWQ